jgi:hypothetical protein
MTDVADQNMGHKNSENIELTDAELDAICILSVIGHAASRVAHKVKDALGDGARF